MYFTEFGLNLESYKINLCAEFKCRKIRVRKAKNTGVFLCSKLIGKRNHLLKSFTGKISSRKLLDNVLEINKEVK